MKVLLVGSGGREHAIAATLARTATSDLEIICAPGSDGTGMLARCVNIDATDVSALAAIAGDERIGLTIVGGEAPLAAGIADAFAARGLSIAAPSIAAARLETSKTYAKNFMVRHGVPTARFRSVESLDEVRAVLRSGEFGERVVVKADGLAAGKGVVVAGSRTEAEAAAAELLAAPSADAAPARLVLEEVLIGREVSLLLWTDGRDYRLMPPAQDHKRVGEGDTGANTGGMGAVTDSGILDDATLARITGEIVEPTLAGLQRDRIDFRGVLYIGLMLTPDGARVLEYNVRFGDPEAQAILVRLESDLIAIFDATARGRLADVSARWSEDASACVVLASRGYPGAIETGARIEGLNEEEDAVDSGVRIFHSGTRRTADGSWQTAGGRVLGVTARDRTLSGALDRCYKRAARITWDGVHYRRDIGRGLLG